MLVKKPLKIMSNVSILKDIEILSMHEDFLAQVKALETQSIQNILLLSKLN